MDYPGRLESDGMEHVLRRGNGDVLRRALDLEVALKRAWAAEYDVEETSRRAYQSDWTEEGCH